MLPHRIRLRGPWQIISGPSAQSLRLPEDWHALGDRSARLTRHFGWPAPLAANERVWLVFDGLTAPCGASLNGQPISPLSPELDITPLLRERNELQLDLSPGACWREAALEVRAQAWLSGLGAERRDDRLTVRGRLNGTADTKLDLYAILERRTVIQAALDAGAVGQLFELTSSSVLPQDWRPTVHVELVCGSTIWHAADVPIRES